MRADGTTPPGVPRGEEPTERRGRASAARTVVLPTALGAGIVLGLATQDWATGRSADTLVAGPAVAASGSTMVPLAGALALTCAAAAVVAVTAGRLVRPIAAAVLLLAGLGAAVAIGYFLADPSTPLAAELATRTGRTSPPHVDATPTWAPWAALVSTLLLVLAGIAALRAAGRTAGLSARYEPPVSDTTRVDSSREQSLWDRVSDEALDDEAPQPGRPGTMSSARTRRDTQEPDR